MDTFDKQRVVHTPTRRPLDMDRLVLIAGGHSAFQLLWAGIELGLYDLLHEKQSCTLKDVTQGLQLQPQPARILLVGLTALGILEKDGDRYRNAELSSQMLVTSSPRCGTQMMGWQRHIVYEGLIDFVESLRTNSNAGLARFPGPGQTIYERLTADPFREKIFQEAMSSLSKQANAQLRQHLPLNDVRHLVDAGGGDGTNAVALCQAFAHLQVSVFDSPSVCRIAQQRVEVAGMAHRVHTWEGNFFHDPFPADTDAILFSHILTIWSAEANIALLKRAHAALRPGGMVIVFNMMGADDDTGPLSTALGSPYFQAIATGQGMLYSWTDYESWFAAAGFGKVRRESSFALNHGMLVATRTAS